MIINPALGFAFVHVPKTGGISIEHALKVYDRSAPKGWGNRLARRLGLRLPIERCLYQRHDTLALADRLTVGGFAGRLRCFAVVRNPYDHAVSHYNFLRQLSRRRYGDLARRLSFEDYLQLRLEPANEEDQIRSRDYWFLRLPDQAAFLLDRRGQRVVDHLIRFEDLQAGWARTLAALDLPPLPLPHHNKGVARQGRDHSEFYSERAMQLVQRIYRRDFDLFGYPL